MEFVKPTDENKSEKEKCLRELYSDWFIKKSCVLCIYNEPVSMQDEP